VLAATGSREKLSATVYGERASVWIYATTDGRRWRFQRSVA
jgi:hypothetical protein